MHVTITISAEMDVPAAVKWAEWIEQNQGDAIHIFVEEAAGDDGLRDGVWCEGCVDEVFPGIRWPTFTNDDRSHSWVERCDNCERYANDEEAAKAVEDYYSDETVARLAFATPVGLDHEQPYVDLAV